MSAALGEFGRALSQREQVRAEQDAEKYRPRDEDRLARAVQRLAAGTYTPSYGLAGEMALANLGGGACGQASPVTGLCAERYHALGCTGHAPGSDGHAELANGGNGALDGLALALSNPGSGDDGPPLIPARTLELAHALNESWGMHGDTPYLPPQAQTPAADWDDLLGPAYGTRDIKSDMARELGRDDLARPQLGQPWPDVSALRAGLGL
ncbi:MAG TPA: hypothetical protein VFQ68_01660 [Streptosporangiaceae bacterium]|nr:hypothetical protein [Streptosporangiaceae bacterium]